MAETFPDVLDMRQVAAKLGKSHSWLKAYLREHPCGRKVGAKRIFTPSDYAALLNSLPRDEPCPVPSRSTRRMIVTRHGGFVEPSADAVFKELRASLRKPKRRNGFANGSEKPTVVSLRSDLS